MKKLFLIPLFLYFSLNSVAMPNPSVYSYIKSNEGFRSKVYKDSLGHLTIGYGTLIRTLRFSRLLASFVMYQAVESCDKKLSKFLAFNNLSRNRRMVLLDMCYQLGYDGLLSFKKMLFYIKKRDFVKASKEVLKSRYYKQTPTRALENATLLKVGL